LSRNSVPQLLAIPAASQLAPLGVNQNPVILIVAGGISN